MQVQILDRQLYIKVFLKTNNVFMISMLFNETWCGFIIKITTSLVQVPRIKRCFYSCSLVINKCCHLKSFISAILPAVQFSTEEIKLCKTLLFLYSIWWRLQTIALIDMTLWLHWGLRSKANFQFSSDLQSNKVPKLLFSKSGNLFSDWNNLKMSGKV